jgi:hypothetical protein
MVSVANILGAPCASPVLPAIPPRVYRGKGTIINCSLKSFSKYYTILLLTIKYKKVMVKLSFRSFLLWAQEVLSVHYYTVPHC